MSANSFLAVIMLDLILLKLRDFIVITSVCLSLSSSEFCQFSTLLCCTLCVVYLPCFSTLLHTPPKWFTLQQLLQFFPHSRNCLGWCNIPQHLHFLMFCLGECILCFSILVIFCSVLCFFILSKYLLSPGNLT